MFFSGFIRSTDNEGLEFFHQIIAVVGIDLQRDGLGQIQTENAQDGLPIHDMTADPQVDIIGITIGDVDEGLYILGETELDVDCFHDIFPHFIYELQ